MTPAERAKQEVHQAERRARALNMRRDGRTYEAIGVELNITPQSAYDMVKRALATLVREPAEETLSLERQRLDAMLVGAIERALHDNPNVADKAAQTVLNIMAHRAKLDGLYAPTKVIVKEEPASKLTDEQLAQAATEAAKVLAKGEP